MRFLALPFALAAWASSLGCINTDPAVFVAPTISAPAATVTSNALGTGITGGAFTLDLHLGARASGPSTVKLGEFSILDAQQTGPIVSPLDVTGSGAFPLTVEPNSDVITTFTFGTGSALLKSTVATQLCAAAGIVISGTIEDSLSGTSAGATSPVFHPSGCP